jgi:hypothetical protein
VSDEIPPDLVDRMMVKCGRRCSICRRFRPTKLQVHHIVERNQRGGNGEDNLIVICLGCHTDVHTKVPFARRFSATELKGHRDALCKMVAEGALPTIDTDDAEVAIQAIVEALRTAPKRDLELSPEALELLLHAVNATGRREGAVHLSDFEGLTVWSGNRRLLITENEKRKQAKYRQAVKELVRCGLLEELPEKHFELTDQGYLAADEIAASRSP